MSQTQSIGEVIQQINPLSLINYSVQLRQHGDKNYRDEIVRFQEKDEISAWKKVGELYGLANPQNKPMQITYIKSCLYPLYSFANTYSQDWYFVLHWREQAAQAAQSVTAAPAEPLAQPIVQPIMPPIVQPVVTQSAVAECPF